MTIELTILLSVLGLCSTVFFASRSAKRADRGDAQREAADMTTVIVKLETISAGVSEIKGEMRTLREDVQQVRERLVKAEEAAKSAHRRLDLLQAGRGEE